MFSPYWSWLRNCAGLLSKSVNQPIFQNNTANLANLIRFFFSTLALKIYTFFHVSMTKNMMAASNTFLEPEALQL